MLYKYTIDNLVSLMQTIGTLKKEQIIRFFSAELASYRIEYLLNQLQIKRILTYDESTDCYSFVGAAHYKKEPQEKVMRAFWPLVAAGSNEVREIILPQYASSQILFITENNDVFDVAVINTHHEALVAQRIRSELIPRGEKDVVSHVAVLKKKEDARILDGCGFDNICIIDPSSKNVSYIEVEDN